MNYNNELEHITKNNNNNKKLILPMIVAITVLILLTLGATFAYIQVQTTNSFGNPTITGTVPPIGSVTINQGASLSLSVTRPEMMKEHSATYYATSNGMNTSATEMQTIANTTVIGEGTFSCTYTLNVKATGDLLKNSFALGSDLVTLEVSDGTNGSETKKYDFNDDLESIIRSEHGVDLHGTLTDLTNSYSRNIQARFKLTNSSEKDQTELNGTSGTITFTITDFNCTATA